MNYREACAYLESTASRGSRLGLERVRELAEKLGNPQKAVQIIHIAGTNGKGSVGAMLASILTRAGYRTGHFSSPAITSVTDYFRINTQEISEERFAVLMTAAAGAESQMEDAPTQFEILAAAAYLLFAEEHCALAVVECCMGGDLDCTNIIDKPLLSIITNVALDHMGFLGSTAAEIALHKAGIIKPDCPVLLGGGQTDPEAAAVIRTRAESVHAPFYDAGTLQGTAGVMTLDGTDYTFDGKTYRLPLLGTYQICNADTVLHAVQILRGQGIALPEDSVREGLSQVCWHGRCEILSREPLVLYDGAHNPDGIRMARQTLDLYFPAGKVIFVIGVMADKAYAGYAEMLKPHMAYVYTVTPDNPRALNAAILADVFKEADIPAQACKSVQEAVCDAVERARSSGLPVVGIGSLYLYREFCEALT